MLLPHRTELLVYSLHRILCFHCALCSVKSHSRQNSQFHLSKQMGSKLIVHLCVCVWSTLKWALPKGFWANFRRINIVFAQLNANAVCSDLINALFTEHCRLISKIVLPSFSKLIWHILNMLVTTIVSFFICYLCIYAFHFSFFVVAQELRSIFVLWIESLLKFIWRTFDYKKQYPLQADSVNFMLIIEMMMVCVYVWNISDWVVSHLFWDSEWIVRLTKIVCLKYSTPVEIQISTISVAYKYGRITWIQLLKYGILTIVIEYKTK